MYVYIYTHIYIYMAGFPCSSVGKEPACNAGDLGLILGSGRSPGEGNGNPLHFLPEKSCGPKEPVRLQSMELQESDTT